MESGKKILWAVDPFSDKTNQLKLAQFLKTFVNGGDETVEPISVLSPDQLRIPLQAFKEKHDVFRLEADKTLTKWTKPLKVPGLQKHVLLLCDEYSRRRSVQVLVDYAKENKTGLIALTTHARKGISRLLMGSFAETLLLQSPIPLLITNPRTKMPTKIKTIFFPTDLSDASRTGYERILTLAEKLKAKVILYHKVEYIIPETYAMVYQTEVYEKYLEGDVAHRRIKAEKWEQLAKQKGVKIELIFDQKPSFVTQAINKISKKYKADLIALVSVTGPASATLLGSITRQVVREANTPVWAVHVFS